MAMNESNTVNARYAHMRIGCAGLQFQGPTSAISQLPQQSRPQAGQVAPAAGGSQAGPLGSGLADLVSSFGQLAMQQPHGRH